jgi:hypothetical protein
MLIRTSPDSRVLAELSRRGCETIPFLLGIAATVKCSDVAAPLLPEDVSDLD